MIVYCLYSDCFGSILAPNVNVCGIRWSYVHAETRRVRTRVALILTHAFFLRPFLIGYAIIFLLYQFGFKCFFFAAANFNEHTMSPVCFENRLLNRDSVVSGRTSKCCARGTATGSMWPVCVQKTTSNNRSGHLATSTIAWPYSKSSATHAGVQC